MLRSLYSGVSGMKGFQVKLDVIGNNIANVNTVGYKKSRVVFQDVLSQNLAGVTSPELGGRGGINPKQVGLGSTMATIDVLHTAGSPMTTGVATDLAIEGDGFFLVQAPNEGPTYLTRAGNFYRDAAGNLVTGQGFLVLGSDGAPIEIGDDYAAFSIAANGQIIGVDAEGEPIEGPFIGVAFVQNPGGLKKVGGSLYEMTPNANPDGELEPTSIDDLQEAGRQIRILSGLLEMSNVDLTEEFTEMIIAQRGFQANSRIITTSDEILQEVVNLKR